jgi:hypothetical protein
MSNKEQEELEKSYMLLRPLPLYAKNTIKPMKSWLSIIGIQQNTFRALIDEGWFK